MKYSLKLYITFVNTVLLLLLEHSPSQRFLLGIPPKTRNNRKIESAWGTTLGMREKASVLSFPFPSCPARFLFLRDLCGEKGSTKFQRFNVRSMEGRTICSRFHDMTSPKFKLRNYRFFWVPTFNEVLQHQTPLSKQIFGSKGFLVLRKRTLELPGFWVTRHLADGQETSDVG